MTIALLANSRTLHSEVTPSSFGADEVARCLESYLAKLKSPTTKRCYRGAVTCFLRDCLEDFALETIRQNTIIRHLESRGKPATQALSLSALKGFFQELENAHIITSNPTKGIPSPIPPGRSRRTLTPGPSMETIECLLRSIDPGTVSGLRDLILIHLLLHGLNINEIIYVNIENYRQEPDAAFIRYFSRGQWHEITVTPALTNLLNSYLLAGGLSEQRGTPLLRTIGGKTGALTPNRPSRSDLGRALKRRLTNAGLTSLSARSLRAMPGASSASLLKA